MPLVDLALEDVLQLPEVCEGLGGLGVLEFSLGGV